MEQKEINYRIAMSMLMQCAIMWELCTKCKAKGEFLLRDVLKMCENIMEALGLEKGRMKGELPKHHFHLL